MPTITINGQKHECRDGVPVLRAALEAGFDVPHYCYHPGLTVVASCRLCLMEMKLPNPKTQELEWVPKLFPSCQTPVKDGMEVRFDSPRALDNVKHTMEYYLVNHPLDCPVCDKAGECYLQDYTESHGPAHSRMVEEKTKNPKKDIGTHTLLYQDRCVLCTRCVRFTQEIAGTSELSVVNRGNRGEIDVFPGVPLENPLQGNVVDLCPVGALLDKEFLFKQRVWMLESADSVCNRCSTGCTTEIDYNDQGIHRVRPRFNEKVNEWWICDHGRFGWRYIQDGERLSAPRMRKGGQWESIRWEAIAETLSARLAEAAGPDRGTAVAAVLSPMMASEEAYLLAKYIRSVAPSATLVGGYVPVIGVDQKFPKGFVIRSEKCPNARGVERILKSFGGSTVSFEQFVKDAGAGKFKAAYIVGGYPEKWITDEAAKAIGKIPFIVTHDLFPSALDGAASMQIPSAAVAEKDGSFVNALGLVQTFDRALVPLEGVKADGQFFAELAGESGLYRAHKIRQQMAASMPEFASPHVPRDEPVHAH